MSERKIALVAGGSGGVGGEICRSLSRDGFAVAVGYRSSPAKAEELVAELNKDGGESIALALDLSNVANVENAVREVVDRYGRVDVGVYAAGPYIPQRWIGEITHAENASMFMQDAGSCFNLVAAVLPALRQARGSFLALTTPAVKRHIPKDSLSSIPKAAVEAIVRSIAVEEARHGVRANAVGVGFIEAGMFFEMRERGDFSDSYVEMAKKNIPLRYQGRASDIADAVAFFASDRARYITGQVLQVDGGLSL
ncbi:SDR family NAD(P)-dependent oxidoreductase [Sinomonas humi]|uniref:Dehydrogenase n=1 Tax=Sinomonas humi TaxID=1338436 RepID=A0A0B2AKR1_9MICC|nr:SDR family oxidoreductase [Sinomonas humi]KHL02468.1 hypothetical protein LK10_12820 [Sinomonas humi]